MSKVTRIIRAPTADNNTPVLVYVEPGSAKGLDIRLYATDGNNVYALSTSITSKNASQYKAQSYQADDKQWQAVLSWFFLQEQPSQGLRDSLGNAEVVSYIEPEKSLELRIRQHVSGITQRMGSITLECNDELEISLFDWANIAAGALEGARKTQMELQTKRDAQQETIDKLRKQLEEIVEAKKTHDDQMLEQFRQLLNTKKLKIRDQQRLLATATIETETVQQVNEERAGTRSSREIPPTTMPARGEKRRAMYEDDGEVKQEKTSPEEDMSDDGGFARGQATPDASEEETEDEDESMARASRPVANREKPNVAEKKNTQQDQQQPFDWQLPDKVNEAVASKATMAVDDDETDDEL